MEETTFQIDTKEQNLTQLYVIMSRTSLRANPHSIICRNVIELLARSRRHIWSLSDSNVIRTHNHLVRKRTLDNLAKQASLAKWLSVGLRTKGLWVGITLLSLKLDSVFVSWLETTRLAQVSILLNVLLNDWLLI